ncbi:MAG: NAD(P)/FAD-dependent oxidoreductase [Bacteroidetes bacterium]|nr:NAD(P)/FAD-dependent oxidoreductase [Bacteroidota bacterium]
MSYAHKYDVVIVGSGLGGLLCGAILAKENLRVCILEKNEQIGGALQTFREGGQTHDTGIHYIGGLDKGQNLYQIFHYLGLMDRLELTRLDSDGFDNILFAGDDQVYPHGMGWDSFVERLSALFPAERDALLKYKEAVLKACGAFALYSLSPEEQYDDMELLALSAEEMIASITADAKLRAVLAGSNMLYAGVAGLTPWYTHALIINHYVESSWRCTKGGDQIARLLAREIKAHGGEIHTKTEVIAIHQEEAKAIYAETSTGEKIYADRFISNVHPAVTLDMIDGSALRPIYKERIKNLPNSVSAFVINAVMKAETTLYQNKNYYFFADDKVWDTTTSDERWPRTYGLFEAVPRHGTHLEALSIMTYMEWSEVEKWSNTEHTTLHEVSRGADYEAFKKEKGGLLLARVAERFPDLVKNIESWSASTPLTWRDYIASPGGSIYGIAKDYHDPLRTMISPNTKIRNLYMTGQNIKLHGVLGVALTALVTCSSILGRDYLIAKIKQANEASA